MKDYKDWRCNLKPRTLAMIALFAMFVYGLLAGGAAIDRTLEAKADGVAIATYAAFDVPTERREPEPESEGQPAKPAPSNHEWKQYLLADGTKSWGPVPGDPAYASFYAKVVLPVKAKARDKPVTNTVNRTLGRLNR